MPIRREVYVSKDALNCSVQCNSDSGRYPQRLELNVGDEFKLVYQFMDSRYSPALMIPLDAFDLRIDYFIKGYPEKTYTVLKQGDDIVNCIMIDRLSIIKAIFSNHGLSAGQLFGKFTFSYPDPDYPDGYGKSIVTSDTFITLVDR